MAAILSRPHCITTELWFGLIDVIYLTICCIRILTNCVNFPNPEVHWCKHTRNQKLLFVLRATITSVECPSGTPVNGMWSRMSAGNHIFNNSNKVMYIAYADMRIVILWDKHPVMLKPYMIITQRRFPIKSTSLLHSELRLGIVLFPGVVCREQSKFRFGVHFSFKVQARVVVMGTARQRGQACRPQLRSKIRLRHNKQMHQMCENN